MGLNKKYPAAAYTQRFLKPTRSEIKTRHSCSRGWGQAPVISPQSWLSHQETYPNGSGQLVHPQHTREKGLRKARETGRRLGKKNTCHKEPALIGSDRRPDSLKGDTKKLMVFGISSSKDQVAEPGKKTSRVEDPL